jgi:hypothetical protein
MTLTFAEWMRTSVVCSKEILVKQIFEELTLQNIIKTRPLPDSDLTQVFKFRKSQWLFDTNQEFFTCKLILKYHPTHLSQSHQSVFFELDFQQFFDLIESSSRNELTSQHMEMFIKDMKHALVYKTPVGHFRKRVPQKTIKVPIEDSEHFSTKFAFEKEFIAAKQLIQSY